MVLEFRRILSTLKTTKQKNNLNKLSDGDIYFLYKAEAPEIFGTATLYPDTVNENML